MKHLTAYLFLFFFLLPLGASAQTAEDERLGLRLEIQVVSQTTLRLAARGQQALPGGALFMDFGDVNAFGTVVSPGVFVEKYQQGAAYYIPMEVTAGSTGGVSHPASLTVQIQAGGNLPSNQFFEMPGERLAPGQNLDYFISGGTKVIQDHISGIQVLKRLLGVLIKPENPTGEFSSQLRFSLVTGGGK